MAISFKLGTGLMLGALAAASLTAPARANDNWLSFGPVSGSGSSASDPTTEREALKEFERNPPAGLPTLSPANIEATKAAIARYKEIVAAGGWKPVPDAVVKPDEQHFAIVELRDRLIVSGELPADQAGGETLDGKLVEALKAYQATNGLTPNGRLDKPTIAALNVSAEDRLKQLETNLKRLAELTQVVKPQRKYVVVNIPAAQVEAVALNRVITRHTGVVGKVDRPTPLLRSTITEMNFNPIWRLPPTVIQKDLIPQGREMQAEGKNVLVKTGIEAYDGNGKKVDPEKIDWNSSAPKSYSYRQPPGKDNPLGFVKINFASGESVYMHDSPSEGLFGRNFRAASSGCIRVHNIERLAYWLLGQNDGWDEDKIAAMKQTGERKDVRLATPVPLHFVYITAWATEDGVIQFRRDLYSRDGVAEIATSY
ncbi:MULTISPECIES: L,D-transpeptidase family protein [Hyphomicrobium]|jgi:murein L,D-transpeptidase YcbB/YkuD|uniref:L,D-transpeptidase family protein n=1 Tax=Hyphomicrobium TaxID=81 RepID=UPI000380C5A9|nr:MULTISPECIES: L,D-transpeptidase family protein [Hyphomicrobium]WBT40064.1 L,D-transpeptidase family protein [Hyphomicrobium sp. DMF-1]HML44399.1 L,D-transpeptidase family protein [Hyphomicrobium zavarzinii]